MSDAQPTDAPDIVAQQVEATAARARVAGSGVPLGGVGPAGSKLDPRSAEQRAAQVEAAKGPGVAQPLGGVDPTPKEPTLRQTRRVDTGGKPLGGVGPAGSSIPKGGGGSVIVGKSEADLVRMRQEQAAARAAAAEAAAPPADPPADDPPVAKKAAAKKATTKPKAGTEGEG